MDRVAHVARRLNPIPLIRRIEFHVVDPRAFALVAVLFGLGVFFVSWHGRSLRLEVEAANLAWIVLVSFGLTWHGEWEGGMRIGGGLVFGSIAAIATYYGVLSRLPITAFVIGLSLGIAAAIVAFVCHAVPRVFSFAGAAVGFGIGIAALRSLPLRPTTPADDLFALMLTTTVCLSMGALGSMTLRALIVRMGMAATGDSKFKKLITHLPHRDVGARRPAPTGPVATSKVKAGR